MSVGLSDHRPDEEGIKTSPGLWSGVAGSFQTTDLMKKGLRQMRFLAMLSVSVTFRPQT